MKRVLVRVLVGIFAILVFALFLSMAFFNSPPVALEKVKAIQAGASKEEVIKALGRPSGRYEGGSKWAYSHPLRWPIVYVYFGEDEKFTSYDYDY